MMAKIISSINVKVEMDPEFIARLHELVREEVAKAVAKALSRKQVPLA